MVPRSPGMPIEVDWLMKWRDWYKHSTALFTQANYWNAIHSLYSCLLRKKLCCQIYTSKIFFFHLQTIFLSENWSQILKLYIIVLFKHNSMNFLGQILKLKSRILIKLDNNKFLPGENYYAIKLASIDNPNRMSEKHKTVHDEILPPTPSLKNFINITASKCELWHFGGQQMGVLNNLIIEIKLFLNIT